MTGPETSCYKLYLRIRSARESDLPVLGILAEQSTYPYPDLSDTGIEAILCVVDANDRPVMASAAKRLVEMYLYVDSSQSPPVKLAALKLLHQGMSDTLRELGYTQLNATLPEDIAGRFGKRLEKTFGWAQSRWHNWFINI